MQLPLDECVPRRLAREITGHEVAHVADLNWQSLVNGELLSRMRERGIEVFVTVDRNLECQQDIAAAELAVVVLIAVRNRLTELGPLLPELLKTLNHVQGGQVIRIGG